MNFARLNHVLIPDTKDGRDRLRQTRLSRIFLTPLSRTYFALSQEGRAVLLFAALAGFAGLDVGRSQSHILWALLLSVLVASLAVRRYFALSRVQIQVEGPSRVMAGENAQFQLTLENRGERVHHGVRIDRPLLPWDGSWSEPSGRIVELPVGEARRLSVSARFEARGEHQIDAFSASALVPLRLALGPRVSSQGTRFTVLPRIAKVDRLRLPSSPRYQPGGVALASLTGESMELVGVRPYRPGDRIRDIHAKTWARSGEPAVRQYQQEYFSRVGVVLDTDASCASEQTLEAAVSLCAGIVARLSGGEALIDVLVTGGRVHSLTLGRSLGHLDQALDHLACVEPGPAFDRALLVELLRPYLDRLSSVVLVALSWDVERDGLASEIRRAGVGCRSVVVSCPKDGRGLELPDQVECVGIDDIRVACERERGLEL